MFSSCLKPFLYLETNNDLSPSIGKMQSSVYYRFHTIAHAAEQNDRRDGQQQYVDKQNPVELDEWVYFSELSDSGF